MRATLKKLLILEIVGVMVLLLTLSIPGCVEKEDKEMTEILKQFDLTDPKIIWEGSIDDAFTDDMVILVLRKTSTYPELELKHFRLENAENMEYPVGGLRPPEYFFSPGYEEFLDGFRQMVYITLKQKGKENVVKAIRQLETLGFVKSAGPNSIGSADEQIKYEG